MLQVKQSINDGAGKIKDVIEKGVWSRIKDFLDLGIDFSNDKEPMEITIGGVLFVIIAFIVTTAVLRFVRGFITRNMERQDELKFISIFKFVRYTVYLVVLLLTLSATGIDITVILTASAALFVGLGLALQQLFQDLIGGISIMLDKSLTVGDIIEFEGKVSRVFQIKMRTTRTLTREDKILIIPNHKFINETIYNYTQNHRTTRESVKVRVAHGADTEMVRNILIDCAERQNGVLKSPKPFVFFEDFAESALMFGIYFFIDDSFADPKIKSEIRFRINDEFRKNNIAIPFPQRGIHFYETDR